MYQLEDIKSFLLSFERNHEVSSWKYEGMDLWPLLRSLIFVECRNEINARQNGVQLDWERKIESKGIKSFLRKVKSKVAIHFKRLKKEEKELYKETQIEVAPVDAMFFGSWYFRTNFEGKFINRFFYPLEKILNDDFNLKSIEVEYATIDKYSEQYKSLEGQIEYLETYHPLEYDENRIRALIVESRFMELFNLLSKVGCEKDFHLRIAQKVEKIFRDSFRYEQLFLNYKPSLAFCLTFFNEQMFAMLFAASKLGVKTVDVGHGFPADPENFIYNRIENFPENGYNTFPNYFWVWGDPVKNAMNQWAQRQKKHQILVGGNPWLEFIRSRISLNLNSNKTVILYTLTVSLPEPYVLEAMKDTKETHEWWVRLHPSISNSLGEVKQLFESNEIENFNLEEANKLDLPSLLKFADVHISRNSSSIFESIIIGNFPILLDEESVKYYDPYIKDELVVPLPMKEKESLLKTVEAVLEKPKEERKFSYLSKKTLSFLFENNLEKFPINTF